MSALIGILFIALAFGSNENSNKTTVDSVEDYQQTSNDNVESKQRDEYVNCVSCSRKMLKENALDGNYCLTCYKEMAFDEAEKRRLNGY